MGLKQNNTSVAIRSRGDVYLIVQNHSYGSFDSEMTERSNSFSVFKVKGFQTITVNSLHSVFNMGAIECIEYRCCVEEQKINKTETTKSTPKKKERVDPSTLKWHLVGVERLHGKTSMLNVDPSSADWIDSDTKLNNRMSEIYNKKLEPPIVQ